jgi:N,N-dimethylformamidase beta subunit-like protein
VRIVAPGVVTAYQPPAPAGGRTALRVSLGLPNQQVVPVGNVTAAQVTGLLPSNTYKVRVRASDAAGNVSAWSDELVLVTAGTLAPATVAVTATVPAPSVTTPSPTPTTVAGAATVPGPAAGFERTYTAAGTTQSVTGLSPAKTYTARVRARDAAGNWSAYSAPLTFTTAGAGTATPATVTGAVSFPVAHVGGAAPTVTAGRARPVVVGGSVQLDVTATPPGGESIIGYAWVIVSGAGSLTGAGTATPTYLPPSSGSGTAVVRATVSATNAGQATADVTVSYHASVVAAENALPGTVRAVWDLSSPNLGGISTLQGFCDGFSIDKTGTANFKIAQSDTAGWGAEVFRLGYYAGDGARSYGTITPSGAQVTASQAQPAPADADPDTTLLSADCAAWSTTLTWTPPAWAPSGIYVLRLNRTGGGASHITFVVRDDARTADLMLMPADSTWNAYNAWGGMGSGQYAGNSLYYGTAVDQYQADCAHYVSYNRPVVNRGAADAGRSYGAVEWSTFFTGEYPMLRFLERNGFDVKYYGCIDAAGDSAGTHLTGNGSTRGGVKAAMFVGHNEYWSSVMRAGWEQAKNRGVSVFSCAGNEVFWRTYGSSPDTDGRPRVQECQKSTINGRGGSRPQWTGSWRDPDGAGKGGNSPENTFTGTIFVVNGPDLRSFVVPFAGGYSAQPLWRDTTVAALSTGQSFTSPSQILGFEWDTYGAGGVDTTGNNFLAAAHPRARFCSTVDYFVGGVVLTDAGDEYGSGTATHRLVVHPGGAGAITFGTGTVNWALGCDNANTYQQGADNTSLVIQQATANVLTDMGAPPKSLMAGLVQPTPVDWYPDIPTAAVTASTSIPGPTLGSGAVATPVVVSGAATISTPVILRTALATPGTVAGLASIAVPTLASQATATPVTVSATATIGTPAVGASSSATPVVVAGSVAIAGPAVAAGNTATPPTLAATTTIGAPAFTSAANPAPAAVVGSTAVGGFAGSATIVTAATVAAAASIPAPVVSAGTVVVAASVQGSATVAAPAVGSTSSAAPATVGVAATIPATAVRASTTTTPGVLAAAAAVAAVTVLTSSAAAPAVVSASVSVPAPTAGSTVTAVPGPVLGFTLITAPAARTGSVVVSATVLVTTTVGAVSRTVGLVQASTSTAQVTGDSYHPAVTGLTTAAEVS